MASKGSVSPDESVVRDDILAIEALCLKGACSMQGPFYRYWPGRGKRQESEVNATFYVGAALLAAGLDLYFEVPYSDARRLDMLAIDHDRKLWIACEAKSFYDLKIGAVTEDVDRLGEFASPNDSMEYFQGLGEGTDPPTGYLNFRRYGLFLALTWREKVAAWWGRDGELRSEPLSVDGDVNDWLPEKVQVRELNAAFKCASNGDLCRRHYASIGQQLGDEGADTQPFERHFLLFAIFPLKPN